MKKFDLGKVVCTIGAGKLLTDSRSTPHMFLDRHQVGDWGDLCEEDKKANDRALNQENPERILSSYQLDAGKLWIITEWTRGVTTLLLPEEY